MSNTRPRKPFPWTCSKCRQKTVYEAEMEYETKLEHDGLSYDITIPKLITPRCKNCGTPRLDDDANEQITLEFLRQAKLLTPKKIRKNREALSLTQKELASALGIAEETVSRWENGIQIQQRSLDNMLRLFFGLPAARQLLTTRKVSRIGLVLSS